MKFRSTKRRAISAVASTAVVAGALATTALLAAPAQAASTTVEDVAFSCSSPFGPMAYTSDIQFGATWAQDGGRAEVTAKFLDDMTTPAPIGGGYEAVLHVTDHNNAAQPKAGTVSASNPTGFNGGVVTAPQLKGKPFAIPGETVKMTVDSMNLTLTNLQMAPPPAPPSSMNLTCTLAAPVTVPDFAVDLPVAAAGTAQLLCTTFGTTFYYPAATTVSATRVSGTTKTDLTVAMSALPGIVPIPFNSSPVTSALDLSVGGTAVQASGAGTATNPENSPIAVPAAKGSVTSSASTLDVAIVGAAFTATIGAPVSIPCVVAAPFTAAGVTVASLPSKACVDAKAKVGPATAAVNSASAKVKAATSKVKTAQAKVTKATKALKKAKKAKSGKKAKVKVAKKKLTAAKKSLSSAKKGLATAKTNLAKANSALATAKKAVTTNC